jgi:hypothetical protein
MARKFTPGPAKMYDYSRASAKCGLCGRKMWETIWKDSERVQIPRGHCTGTMNYLTPGEDGKLRPFRKGDIPDAHTA